MNNHIRNDIAIIDVILTFTIGIFIAIGLALVYIYRTGGF